VGAVRRPSPGSRRERTREGETDQGVEDVHPDQLLREKGGKLAKGRCGGGNPGSSQSSFGEAWYLLRIRSSFAKGRAPPWGKIMLYQEKKSLGGTPEPYCGLKRSSRGASMYAGGRKATGKGGGSRRGGEVRMGSDTVKPGLLPRVFQCERPRRRRGKEKGPRGKEGA